ncbi:MAG: cadmium-translocating P-type ATPase [Ruminococcaceae bacterium]|nr:cadmium-translocating P-type ATPase [Oscillospiraceae bacterium]
MLAPLNGSIKLVLFLIPYLIIGYDILIKAVKGVLNAKLLDENFLMAVATIGAFLLGEYTEGAFVMLFYQIGELFQSYAVGKSRKNISSLMDIRPDWANIEDENKNLIKVSPDEVETGSIIIVKPGEKIPIDGIIQEGLSSLNTSALTGESAIRDVTIGDNVLSGCINISGVLKIKTTKNFDESTASKILDLVENASSKKSRSENFISKFARIYTPCVCILALMLAIFVPVFNLIFTPNPPVWDIWFLRALTFLVISCPCALVISVPLSFFAGIGGASSCGILIKGSNYIETLSKVKYVVFDKTGTMTEGSFNVSKICSIKANKDALIEYAALAESYSDHPISKGIQKAYGKDIDKKRVSNVNEISGKGITCVIDNNIFVAVGNDKLMQELNINFETISELGSVVYIAVNNEYMGYILISDVLKPDSKEAVKNLKDIGIKKTVMLTGDLEKYGNHVAKLLDIDIFYTNLLPQDKVKKIEDLLENIKSHEKLAFVGDGINDAPSLSRADVGIAMGALGSDAAIEAADVVLMNDNPKMIAKAIKISKKCMRIVYQNIYFAIGIKTICLILGALGIADMNLAIFADVGVMVIAVLNAIRTLYVKKL